MFVRHKQSQREATNQEQTQEPELQLGSIAIRVATCQLPMIYILIWGIPKKLINYQINYDQAFVRKGKAKFFLGMKGLSF